MRLFAAEWWRSIKPHDEHNEALAVRVEDGVGDANYLISTCVHHLGVPGCVYTREPANILREIVGNPFRPPQWLDRGFGISGAIPSLVDGINPLWLKPTVIDIAQNIYNKRDFSAMPILHDALIDVGCDNDDILEHLRRDESTHIHGCWVIGLLLKQN